MYFVDEEDGTVGGEKPVGFGSFYDLSNILHTAGHGTQRVEGRLQFVGNNLCQRGLTDSRRSPKNEGGDASGINHVAQDSTWSNQVLLSDVVVQRAWTQSFC